MERMEEGKRKALCTREKRRFRRRIKAKVTGECWRLKAKQPHRRQDSRTDVKQEEVAQGAALGKKKMRYKPVFLLKSFKIKPSNRSAFVQIWTG